jgi:hypothetical protein
MTEGVKDDAAKVQLDLLSPIWVLGVGRVLTFGAKKYSTWNWAKGLSRTRLLASVLRHLFAYLGGEDLDPETGLLHLDHASCELMFASHLHHSRPDLDDRWKEPKSTAGPVGYGFKLPSIDYAHTGLCTTGCQCYVARAAQMRSEGTK